MALTSIAPWFGGKRTMAPLVVKQLGEHRAYYEPFCGSCAVVFAKPHSSIEIVNDLHGDLTNLARVLASDDWRELYETADRFLLCQEWLSEITPAFAEDFAGEGPDVQRAAQYLAISWMTRNGVAGLERGGFQMAVRWTQNGGSPGIRWRSAVDSIPAWHDRLKGVVITRRDGIDLVERSEDAERTAIYCDPPYLKDTRSGSRSSATYLYDFDDLGLFGDEHSRLAAALNLKTKSRVVVSYYDHPRLSELYPAPRWTKLDCKRQKNLHVQNRRGTGYAEAPEVLLVNGKVY